MDTLLHLKRSMKIKRQACRDTSSSRSMSRNLRAPSLIEWTRLKDINSHSCITSEPLAEDEESNRATKPNFAYIYACSLMFRVIKLFRHLNP